MDIYYFNIDEPLWAISVGVYLLYNNGIASVIIIAQLVYFQ